MRLICVSGNIAAGKTTYIDNFVKNMSETNPSTKVIVMKELLDEWQPYFAPYYEALKHDPEEVRNSLKYQSDIISFQLVTSLTRYKQYLQIQNSNQKSDQNPNLDPKQDPNSNVNSNVNLNVQSGSQVGSNDQVIYIFERTVQEALKCFLPALKPYLSDLFYDTLHDFQKAMTRFEPNFDEKIILGKDLSEEDLLNRIHKRNRKDEIVSLDYLKTLNSFYKDFIQEDNQIEKIENQVYVIGPIAAGKTTLVSALGACCRTQIEHLKYWSYLKDNLDLLQYHLKNVNDPKNKTREVHSEEIQDQNTESISRQNMSREELGDQCLKSVQNTIDNSINNYFRREDLDVTRGIANQGETSNNPPKNESLRSDSSNCQKSDESPDIKRIEKTGPVELSCTYSYVFQLRVLASRILFQQTDTVYERNIIEEYVCFIQQYKHLFTELQYNLLEQYYKVLLNHFLKDAIIIEVKTKDFDTQMKQLAKRNRKGEDQYTVQYMQELNSKYDDLNELLREFPIRRLYYIMSV